MNDDKILFIVTTNYTWKKKKKYNFFFLCFFSIMKYVVDGEEHELQFDATIQPSIHDCVSFAHQVNDRRYTWFRHDVYKSKQKNWPSTTSLCCWHDGESFTTVPVPIVNQYYEETNIYDVYGVFCSVNCAKAYIVEHEPYISNTRMTMFNHMVCHVYRKSIPVKPAPPRIRLAKYGGDLTIDEFRTNFEHVHCALLTPPFVPTPLYIRYEHNTKTTSQTNPLSAVIKDKHASMYEQFYQQQQQQKKQTANVNEGKKKDAILPPASTKAKTITKTGAKKKRRPTKKKRSVVPPPKVGSLSSFVRLH